MEDQSRYRLTWVVAAAALIYLATLAAPPHLMDDVDAVQAQIARNMLESGDWVTARLDGVAYLEKSPLKYWMMAVSFALFGISDWAARLPVVLSILALCALVAAMGRWAFGAKAGLLAGLSLATCIGLFLFTRILIPDVILTGTIALSLWAMMRALEDDDGRDRYWAAIMGVAMGAGLLLKGLIAVVFPVAAAGLFLLLSGQLFLARTWKRLHPWLALSLLLLVAAPWHILATLRNPPYLDFTMKSEPGRYRGFFWFYFLNEHVLRFLNLRHPRDYNTVPRHLFWLFHLLWLFPWSAWLAGIGGLRFRGADRASRMRLLCLCLGGFILVFFSFSTTQEYYSLPAYPAFALLLGCVLAEERPWHRFALRMVGAVATLAFAAIAFLLARVWNTPAPGDISRALTQNPEMYTLSLGHMGDLTIASFAYLKLPLAIAGLAFLAGAVSGWTMKGMRAYAGLALMMILFLHAARIAMISFDPYLSSKPLAEALKSSPPGTVILDNQYYTFSSVFFYAGLKRGLLLNGRVNNLEYGSYAPGAPDVFLDDARLPGLWNSSRRCYLLVEGPSLPRLRGALAGAPMFEIKSAGGKHLFTNQPL
jgi:4-amino-4-deoxy-L-arabinose transferase-like glycosyltransferase